MKRIIVTEEQYRRLVKQNINEFIKYENPKDEYNVQPLMGRFLGILDTTLMDKHDTDTYVKKIKKGIVELDSEKYNEYEKETIKSVIDWWVNDTEGEEDSRGEGLSYNTGNEWEYIEKPKDIDPTKDTEGKEKIKVEPDYSTTDTSSKISLGTKTKKGSEGKLTSKPQQNRRGRPHHGYDIVGPYSKSVIISNKKGVVTYADKCGDYGKLVEIDHGDGILSAYAHLKDIYVKKGQEITVGTPIGLEGNTGKSKGRHLHFEERVPRPEGKKDRCGQGSPYNEVYGYNTVRPISVVNQYFYYQEGL
jgi:murein DD-endopeptidase MepM/ murein hydrolase activator NlpD